MSLTTPDVGFADGGATPIGTSAIRPAVEVDRIIGDRTSWDPGVDLGGGIAFRMGETALFYVETRWHYMWGPQVTDGQGVVQKANGQYLPVTFGFRF